MAKRKNEWTETKVAKYQKEGRGSGELSNYKPWLTIQDVPSSGRAHRLKGWKTSRIHHLLSDLERDYFYLLEWADHVIDIREQYPLDREKTLQIAESKQIRHPIDTASQTPIVFTTDFFITVRKNRSIEYFARTVKPSEKLNDSRVIEKFEIEREYWEQMGVDWGIVTEKETSNEAVKNIGWLHSSYEISNLKDEEFIMELYNHLHGSADSIGMRLRDFDQKYHLEQGSALSLLKYLLANKKILFDIKEPFNLANPADSLIFSDHKTKEKRLAK